MVNTTLPIVSDTGGQVISMQQFGYFLIAAGLVLCGVGACIWTSDRKRMKRIQPAQPPEPPPATPRSVAEGFAILSGRDVAPATSLSHRGRHKANAGELDEITTTIHRPDGAS